MFNRYMLELGSKRSAIRELHEFGRLRAESLGADSVFDFSIGNPSVPPPDCVRQTIKRLVSASDSVALHSYTSAQGSEEVRKTIADDIKQRFGVNMRADLIYMTCGASAALTAIINALAEEGDEFILPAPYFPEYTVYVTAAGAKHIDIPFKGNFDIDLDALEAAINKRTKAIIINSPNNPSGKVYSEDMILRLAEILERKNRELGITVYVIADEPYRELVFNGQKVPFVMNYYKNTAVCYSYSKSLSLPGERIGYIAVSPEAENADELYLAILGAGRALGFVCAPTLFQQVVAKCLDARPDLDIYRHNGKLLYDELTAAGFECAPPEGAFYLFVKAPDGNSQAMSERAKQLGILIVPGDDFAAKGYCRVAYCVDESLILRAAPLFKKLADSYK